MVQPLQKATSYTPSEGWPNSENGSEPALAKANSVPVSQGWEDQEDASENGWPSQMDEDQEGGGFAGDVIIDMPMDVERGYKAVKSQLVSQQVLKCIEELQDLFALDLDKLIIIARHYSWNQERMQDWFTQQDTLQYELGLVFDETLVQRKPEINYSLPANNLGNCMICYENFSESNPAFGLSCNHQFCVECWREYLVEKVQSGYQGIDARCMQAGCNMKVGHSTFESILAGAPKDKETYWKWLCKSFTDDNKDIKWCPNVQCEYCCEKLDPTKMLYEVTCECGTEFCFQCGEFVHRPCDCGTAQTWMQKASAESENITWISANTKTCPGCQKSIEKNQGCNHMTCAQCRHEFCWICMGDWKSHGSATGGYYKCNLYEEKKKDQSFMAEERKREDAANELQRYMWYYERYANHDRSAKLATKLLPVIKQKINMLHEVKNYPPKELEFLEHGCETVIKCRDVLRWTYAYAYYRDRSMTEVNKNLFQQWQSDLEKYCDFLHGLVEKDLDQYMDPNVTDRSPFFQYRSQLTSYFESTSVFSKNLIEGVKQWDTM